MVSLAELVGLSMACGAADVGGPLSERERTLATRAERGSSRAAAHICRAIRNGEDPLGEALLALRPGVERRPMGAFYTGYSLLEPMVAWALKQHPARFVDPGCGSGRFAVAAAMRHRRMDIVAIDLDPLATLLTRAALAAVRAQHVRVIQGDYLSVSIPRIHGRTAFVGNPPYVRHHELSANTKAHATRLAAKAGHPISGLAGLHALFYLATFANHGVAGDIGSFVTSAEWLDVGYGSVIRAMFTNGLGGRSITVFDAASVPFDDVMTTAAITTFRLGEELRTARFSRVVDAPSTKMTVTLEDTGRDVLRATLAQAGRWSPFFRDHTTDTAVDTIGTRFRVSRGQVTGANDFFVMTRRAARERGLAQFCVPLITGAEEVLCAGGVLRGGPERLVGLEIPKGLDVKRYPRLAAYLRAGEAAGIHERYVTSHRAPWWSFAYPRPPIVATYMARQAPVFAANPDALGLLNVVHGLHPRLPMDDRTIALIVATLNANRASFIGRGRTYHGGLEKFEPREMEALPLEGLT